jgi:hypothetical protein
MSRLACQDRALREAFCGVLDRFPARLRQPLGNVVELAAVDGFLAGAKGEHRANFRKFRTNTARRALSDTAPPQYVAARQVHERQVLAERAIEM